MEKNLIILKDNLKKDIESSGWADVLFPYIDSKLYDDLTDSLVSLVEQGKRFTPKFKDIFNAFKECKYDDLKVVIVGQDPYPQLGSADGLAFSCSKKDKVEKSLQYINKAIDTDHTDLRCWANQGVLLINTALTVEVNKIGSHYSIWKSFTEYLFDTLNRHNKGLVFILMGKKAEEWAPLLSNMKIYKVAHPASAAYRGGEWDCKNVFALTNAELDKQGKTWIEW